MTKFTLTVVTALSLAQACFALEARGADKTSAYTRHGGKYNPNVKTYYSDVYTPCTKTETVQTTTTEIVNEKHKLTTTVTTTQTIRAYEPSTYTVPASAGFIPVRSSLPDPGAPKDASAQDKRSAAPVSGLARRDYNAMNPGQYPQRVDVYHYKEKKQCITQTKTVTETQKACKTPVQFTVTSTATCKVTVYPSTTTVYAACQTNNMLPSYRGANIREVQVIDSARPDDEGFGLVRSDATDATACCVAAITMSPPSFVWTFNSGSVKPDAGRCAILTDDTCKAVPRTDSATIEATVYSDARPATDEAVLTVGNSYCGQWNRGCYDDAKGVRTCVSKGDANTISQDVPVNDPALVNS
ncbi:hypothetical protein DOTSEDRAFT_23831 [Dothistroma septosporum NZE10]|uniref:Ig-like domain-containing protein n=1 Tax=Dothistroma septosporum (strain NZE10 / CBS 128990) TaxID=675120 RepID=N1PQY1_DOTSN|nr:hypothetical protein DOTSEDRAFT_23831 [Dothistroma septosporum NZE10]